MRSSDAAVMLLLRRQCRPPSASRPRIQSRQLHANAGPAQGGGALVADQPAREADQDSAKVVSHGRYVTFQMAEVAVSQKMFAEATSAARAGMTGEIGTDATDDDGRGASRMRVSSAFRRSVQSTMVSTVRCASGAPFILSKTREGATLSTKHRGSGECRLRSESRRTGHAAAIGSIRLGSLFLTLPTRALTDQQIISPEG